MGSITQAILKDYKEDRDYLRQRRKFVKDHKLEIEAVAAELKLPSDSIIGTSASSYEFNLSVSGTAAELKEVFRAFRKLGYEPNNRPGIKPESSFSCRFKREDAGDWYFNFSSKVCRRIKVGTETKEVTRDIYETVCE